MLLYNVKKEEMRIGKHKGKTMYYASPIKVRVEVKGQKVELDYPSQFKAELETIKLDDPRLSNVWGKEIYRITLKTEEKKATGNYKFVIQQVK